MREPIDRGILKLFFVPPQQHFPIKKVKKTVHSTLTTVKCQKLIVPYTVHQWSKG